MRQEDVVFNPGDAPFFLDDADKIRETAESFVDFGLESIPIHPGRSTAADPVEPTLADVGIHNRRMARAAGLRTEKPVRGMAIPSKRAKFPSRRSQ